MCGYFLRNDDSVYVKDVDTANCLISFTENVNEAKKYDGEWFADTELEYLKFHFKDKGDTLNSMHCVFVDTYEQKHYI